MGSRETAVARVARATSGYLMVALTGGRNGKGGIKGIVGGCWTCGGSHVASDCVRGTNLRWENGLFSRMEVRRMVSSRPSARKSSWPGTVGALTQSLRPATCHSSRREKASFTSVA